MSMSLPPRTVLRLFATRSNGGRHSIIQRQSGGITATTTSQWPSQSSSLSSCSNNPGRGGGAKSTTAASLLASLAYSTLSTATIVLCENNNNSDDDENFISKLKSKLQNQSIPTMDIDAIATSLGSSITSILTSRTLDSVISSGIPTDLSYGFFAGYFSGLALKKIGRVAGVALGASFLALQTLAYAGYIDVHHEKLQEEVEGLLDRNQDGVVDAEDLRRVLGDVKKVAGFGLEDGASDAKLMASGGGFGLGFWGGLRSG
mmetsp:Transcript_31222/g.66054  ORF Transcript_31222/g.66054 Transcript_31222/m.66054 type:complete len:260 (+) Transcript_31222:43-822(+)